MLGKAWVRHGGENGSRETCLHRLGLAKEFGVVVDSGAIEQSAHHRMVPLVEGLQELGELAAATRVVLRRRFELLLVRLDNTWRWRMGNQTWRKRQMRKKAW